MDSLVESLFEAICEIPLIDPHSHVDPRAPAARSLNDLLGYHYYTELAHSAGLARAEIEGTTGPAQVELILEWLTRCPNAIQCSWLAEIARAFFGWTGDELGPEAVPALLAGSAPAFADPRWPDRVRERTKLEAIFLTNDFDDPLEGFDSNVYVPCLRTDDVTFKLDQPAIRERFEKATGMEPTDQGRIGAGLDVLFERFVRRGARAAAISLPPDFEPERPSLSEADASLDRLLIGAGDSGDRQRVSHAVFYAIADRCERWKLPFDLMIGVYRDVYPAGVHQGRDLFDQRTSLYAFRKLFNDKPNVVFPVSVLTSNQNQELVSYAWIFPNVVTNGHWWYSNIPAYIEADLRARLEAVPGSKQIGYYSDAYKLEFVLPKFNMYRRSLARVLASDFIQARGWSEARALRLARAILRDNVERIFPPTR